MDLPELKDDILDPAKTGVPGTFPGTESQYPKSDLKYTNSPAWTSRLWSNLTDPDNLPTASQVWRSTYTTAKSIAPYVATGVATGFAAWTVRDALGDAEPDCTTRQVMSAVFDAAKGFGLYKLGMCVGRTMGWAESQVVGDLALGMQDYVKRKTSSIGAVGGRRKPDESDDESDAVSETAGE